MNAAKTSVTVRIAGEEHTIRASAEPSYTRKCAELVDERIHQIRLQAGLIEGHKAGELDRKLSTFAYIEEGKLVTLIVSVVQARDRDGTGARSDGTPPAGAPPRTRPGPCRRCWSRRPRSPAHSTIAGIFQQSNTRTSGHRPESFVGRHGGTATAHTARIDQHYVESDWRGGGHAGRSQSIGKRYSQSMPECTRRHARRRATGNIYFQFNLGCTPSPATCD